METRLILKRASTSRASGQWSDEDYDAPADGKVVGRILESGSRFDPPDLLWTWSITSIWPATRGVTNGTAATAKKRWQSFVRRGRRRIHDHTLPPTRQP
jgi:hypothetical protein